MNKLICPFCEGSEVIILINNIYPNYDLVKCEKCEVISAYPFTAPEAAFYTNASDPSSNERHTKMHEFSKDHPCRRSQILKHGDRKNLLDVGCGNGAFAKIATENGFQVLGIDLDIASLELAPKRGLKNVTYMNALISDLANNKAYHSTFDIITMFEVFEHLDNPNETIENIKILLKPNGYFIGSLPNISRPFMWSLNMSYEIPPYHLSYWTPSPWSMYLIKNQFHEITLDNSNYYGYLSDIFVNKYASKVKLLHTLSKVIFQGVKVFIEKPLEKIFNKPAGFYFEFQKT
jgi:2-polyprenyl-3-methyl-5-hydroxy-6-metoxy-1,4-benzoquinol methylase